MLGKKTNQRNNTWHMLRLNAARQSNQSKAKYSKAEQANKRKEKGKHIKASKAKQP